MKYIEYIYLAASMSITLILAQSWGSLNSSQRIAMIAGVLITSFMFSFRRKQRIALEKEEEQKLMELEKELEDDPDA